MQVVWYYIQVAETDKTCGNAGVAQLVEQLICNQQVGGSSPSTSSTFLGQFHMGGFPSGQREQTVNLSSMTSVVRIHHLPPTCADNLDAHEKHRTKVRCFSLYERIYSNIARKKF